MLRRLAALCARHPERGATAVEYALMVALIAGVIFAAVAAIGPPLVAIFADAASRV